MARLPGTIWLEGEKELQKLDVRGGEADHAGLVPHTVGALAVLSREVLACRA